MKSRKTLVLLLLLPILSFNTLFSLKASALDRAPTLYSTASPAFFYSENYPDSINSFATALSMLKKRRIPPSSIYSTIKRQGWEFRDRTPNSLIKNLSSYCGLSYATYTGSTINARTVTILKALNSNHLVIARASGIAPFSSNESFVVIYAAHPDGYFKVFSPSNASYRGEYIKYETLLSAMKQNITFYFIK